MTQGEPGAPRLAGRAQESLDHLPFLRGRHRAQALCLDRMQGFESHAGIIRPVCGAGKSVGLNLKFEWDTCAATCGCFV